MHQQLKVFLMNMRGKVRVMKVDNKLALSVRLVIEYLEQLEENGKIVKWDAENSVVKGTFADASGKSSINVIGVAIEPEIKGMISLYRDNNNESVAQGIFHYEKDFDMDSSLKFPLEYERYMQDRKEKTDFILQKIATKLKLGQFTRSLGQEEIKERDQQSNIGVGLKSRDESRDAFRSTSDRRPADMPGFEDEYEIQNESNVRPSVLQELGHSYGDNDLYPTGQKYPNLGDPSSLMRPLPSVQGGGGMILDPFQERAKERERQESKTRGPGWIPGAKFDDPYGNPGFGNNPGSGSGSSGFGFGGGAFI